MEARPASQLSIACSQHAGLVMVNSEWLSSTVYADFRRAICQDLVRCGDEIVSECNYHTAPVCCAPDNMNRGSHSHPRNTQEDPTGLADCTVSVMSDNFGFVQLPLTCLILNMVWAMELQAVEVSSTESSCRRLDNQGPGRTLSRPSKLL
jgi:hypothetical protein